MGWPTSNFTLDEPTGGSARSDLAEDFDAVVNEIEAIENALGGPTLSKVLFTVAMPPPSGDTSGITDTAAWMACVEKLGFTYSGGIPSGGNAGGAIYFPGGHAIPYYMLGNQVVPHDTRVYSDVGTSNGSTGHFVIELASPNNVSTLFCSAKWLTTGSPTSADPSIRVDHLTINMNNAAIVTAANACTLGTDGVTIEVPSTTHLAPGMLVSDISNVGAWAGAGIGAASAGATISSLTTLHVQAPTGTTNSTPTAGWPTTGEVVVATSTGGTQTYSYTGLGPSTVTGCTPGAQTGPTATTLAIQGSQVSGAGDANYGYGPWLPAGLNGTTIITSVVDATHITVSNNGAATAWASGGYGYTCALQFSPHAIVGVAYRNVFEFVVIEQPQGCGIVLAEMTAFGVALGSVNIEEDRVNDCLINYTNPNTSPIPAFNGGATPPGSAVPIGGQHGIWTTHWTGGKNDSDSFMERNVVVYSGDTPFQLDSAADWKIAHNHPWSCSGPAYFNVALSGCTFDDNTSDMALPGAGPVSCTYYGLYGRTAPGEDVGAGATGASSVTRNRMHSSEDQNNSNVCYCFIAGPNSGDSAWVAMEANSWQQDVPGDSGTSYAYQFNGRPGQLFIVVGASEIGGIGTTIVSQPIITGTTANVTISNGDPGMLQGIPVEGNIPSVDGDALSLFQPGAQQGRWNAGTSVALPSLAGIRVGAAVSSPTNPTAFLPGTVVASGGVNKSAGTITTTPPPQVSSTKLTGANFTAASVAGDILQIPNAGAAQLTVGMLASAASGIIGSWVVGFIDVPGGTNTPVTITPCISGTQQGSGTPGAVAYTFSDDSVIVESFLPSHEHTLAAQRLTSNPPGSTLQSLQLYGLNGNGPPSWQASGCTVTDTPGSIGGIPYTGTITIPAVGTTAGTSPFGIASLNIGQQVNDSVLLSSTTQQPISGPGSGWLGSLTTPCTIVAIVAGVIYFNGTVTSAGTDTVQFAESGVFIPGDRVTDQDTPAMWHTPGGQQVTGLAPADWTNDWLDPTLQGNVHNTGLFFPLQAPTVDAPTYVQGGMYFDTTLKKLRIGGATAWETVTSV